MYSKTSLHYNAEKQMIVKTILSFLANREYREGKTVYSR